MYVKLYSAYVEGIEGQVVEVEVDIAYGLPQFEIVGLPGSALKESKERVRAAIRNSGYQFPNKRITVNLAPAALRKEGAYFDCVMALAILIADEQISISPSQLQQLQKMMLIGELALDGSTRRLEGILPLLFSAQRHGFTHVFIPLQNHAETEGFRDIEALGVDHFRDILSVVEQLKLTQGEHDRTKILHRFKMDLQLGKDKDGDRANDENETPSQEESESFEDIQGQEHVKRAFEVAALGFHHMLMVGPPGSGKTMFARRFPTLLPVLTEEEMMEVAKIQSVAGLLKDDPSLWKARPFRAPHHTITAVGMMGGGRPVKPGEVSIAHRGVLFLDEFLEFDRSVMEGLREPLEDHRVSITRYQQRYTFPAQFVLILAFNPCPCGYYGYETEQHPCTCSSTQIERYRSKLSGPLYDRMDIQIDVPLMGYEEMTASTQDTNSDYTTVKMQKRVEKGKAFKRYRGGSQTENGMLTPAQIKKECVLTKPAEELLRQAYDRIQFSARGYHKILKIARTIADLNESERIDEAAIAEAIGYRSLDRGL